MSCPGHARHYPARCGDRAEGQGGAGEEPGGEAPVWFASAGALHSAFARRRPGWRPCVRSAGRAGTGGQPARDSGSRGQRRLHALSLLGDLAGAGGAFRRGLLLWAGIFAASAVGLVIPLAAEPTRVFLLSTTVVTVVGVAAGTLLSVLWFIHMLHRFGQA